MSLAERLERAIADSGPMPVARWMALCNAHYYATRDPIGAAGDFTTAPEISQLFGELVGAWVADLWLRAGRPAFRLVELGPGRGTLMADLLRATARVPGFAPPVHFVETSPVLRRAQAALVPAAAWHAMLAEVPGDLPLLIVANEFFDALPVRQFEATADGWHERVVGRAFQPGLDPVRADALIPPELRASPPGSVFEASPAATAVAAEIGDRLRAAGGAALIVDYGFAGPATSDTLQAVHRHEFADPFARPGEVDLTAHVDFTALAAAAAVRARGPVGQGAWLASLGIGQRLAALTARASPAQAAALAAGARRLTAPGEMGDLFKVMALVAPDWPEPAGFA